MRAQLAQWLPFYYGWVIFAIAASAAYTSRPLRSVAVLSVFVVPMTGEFGWSRGLFAGAVSLGGLCAVAISPVVGRVIDKYGSGGMISASSAAAGACAVGLSAISQPWAFYALYVPGRMVFASPLELATSTAISNWFIRRRAFALALLGVMHGTGLATMPLIAQLLIVGWGWRSTWAFLGLYTMALGILPSLLLMVRRPEDIGLEPDPLFTSAATASADAGKGAPDNTRSGDVHVRRESQFTLRQAFHTRAFWVLAAFLNEARPLQRRYQMTDYRSLEQRLMEALGLQRRPVAVTFQETPPPEVPKFMGTEPSGCSFWRLAAEGRTFYTVPSDHYNCAIGSYTHNIPLPPERAAELDQTLSFMTGIGYIQMEEVPGIPRLPQTPGVVIYAPLGDTPVDPDVVLFADRPGRVMLLQEAALRAGITSAASSLGRPTCMALPAALAQGVITSTGCIGNRVYTDLGEDEMYMAVPGKHMARVADEVQTIATANAKLAAYHRERRQALTTE